MDIIFLVAVTLIAYFVKGITGFGNTLVMNALFSFVKENRFTTPVDLLLSLPTNIQMAWKNRKVLDYSIVMPFSLAVVLGDIPGVLLLKYSGDNQMKILLGVVLIVLGVEMIRTQTTFYTNVPKILTYIVGFISGCLMGIFGIGAFIAAYLNRTSSGRDTFRANLCFIFIVDNVFRLIAYILSGIMTRQVIILGVLLLPVAFLGMKISTLVDKKLSDQTVKQLVTVLLIISGVTLIIKNI